MSKPMTRLTGSHGGWPLAFAALLSLTFACSSDSLKPEDRSQPSDVYWSLDLSHHAVTLALTPPYDTLMLAATPRNYAGETLANLPAPQFISADPQHVAVTNDGTLIAVSAHPVIPKDPTDQAQFRRETYTAVIARLTVGNITHVDTVVVRVMNAATFVLDQFSIHPVPPDTAKSALVHVENVNGSVPGPLNYAGRDTLNNLVHATSTAGESLTDLLVAFRSSDSTTALVAARSDDYTTVKLYGQRAGTAQIYATTTVFGVTKADTLLYRIGWPLDIVAHIDPSPYGATKAFLRDPDLKVGVGGAVMWESTLEDTVDITFADTTNLGAYSASTIVDPASFVYCFFLVADCANTGNFLIQPASASTFVHVTGGGRLFPVAGTYQYQSMRGGFGGKVTVVDER